MWRRLSVGLTSLVVIAGLWGITLWWNRPQPPPLGDITLEEVTPPFAELAIWPQPYCNESVPGFWATGRSQRTVKHTLEWFDQNFGPAHQEATARLNERYGRPNHRVYDTLEVFARPGQEDVFLWVQTYETVSHYCIRDAHDPWDLENAAAFEGECGEQIIEFWGVQYRATSAERPPPGWDVIALDADRAIAHDIEALTTIYAKAGPQDSWMRYELGGACAIE